MKFRLFFVLVLALTVSAFSVSAQDTVELRLVWYNDGNEGEVIRDLLDRFEADNPDIRIVIDTLPYADLHTTLQAQVEAGEAPDLARVNDVARFHGQYLDLTPYVADADYYLTNFPEAVLDSLRANADDNGLYGFPLQFSVTIPFINRTLFEDAGIEVPAGDATWDEWIAAATEVAEATGTPYAVAIDRTGHRFWGFSIPYGANYYDEDGNFLIDTEGFRAAAEELIRWNREGLTPPEVWAGSGGAYVAATEYFINEQVVLYYAGTWQIQNFTNNIGDRFDWELIPNPMGPAGKTGIPGGSLFVSFAGTRYPEQVGRVMDYLTSEDVLAEFSARTLFIPGHLGLVEQGIEYPASNEALNTALAEIPEIDAQAFALQYSPFTFVLNPEIRDRLSQVIVGEITLDEAITLIQTRIDTAVAEAGM
ncbi:extracellular solute-binding protein [Kamptonema cortianum]|nr:extracellular solute-binding protein [Kamptonema cortianum]